MGAFLESWEEGEDSPRYRFYSLCLIFLSFCVHALFAWRLELFSQEAYYWLWSTIPSLSYYDHPPMVAWSVYFSTQLFGSSELAVRLPALLYSVGDMILLRVLAASVFNERVAFLTLLLFSVTFIFHGQGFLMTPDAPLLFFTLASMLAFYRLVRYERGRDVFWVGLFSGCALLSKYPAGLLAFSYILSMLFIPKRCTLRFFGKLCLGAVIALVVFSPVLIWNAQHDWISITYQSERRVEDLHLSIGYFFGYFASQAALLNPFVYIVLIYALFAGLKRVWEKRDRDIIFLLSFALPGLLLYSAVSIKTWVKLNWVLPSYFPLFILAAWAVYHYPPSFSDKTHFQMRKYFNHAVVGGGGIIAFLLFVLLLCMPFESTPLERFAGGWKQTVERLENFVEDKQKEGVIAKDAFLYAFPYKLAALAAYYSSEYDVTATGFQGENARAFNYIHADFPLAGRDGIFIFEHKKGYHSIPFAAKGFESSSFLGTVSQYEEGGGKQLDVYLMKHHR